MKYHAKIRMEFLIVADARSEAIAHLERLFPCPGQIDESTALVRWIDANVVPYNGVIPKGIIFEKPEEKS